MKITDKEFCEMYSSYYGETIDNISQLVSSTFDGEELKEFIEHCIKCKNNGVSDDVNQQSELLLAYEQSKCPENCVVCECQVKNDVNDFLANNCG